MLTTRRNGFSTKGYAPAPQPTRIGRPRSSCSAKAGSSSGYIDSSLWTTRELLEAISPRVGDQLFARLEEAIVDLAPDWERAPGGYSAFTLLSGLDEARLSAAGKRRLGELRRKFDLEQPPEPMGIRIQSVGSPIPQEAARRMDDGQWLGAIGRYSTGERERGIELRGDAEELARVLEAEAKRDAERFARLALSFTSATHPAYSEAILRGTGDPEAWIARKRSLRGAAPSRGPRAH